MPLKHNLFHDPYPQNYFNNLKTLFDNKVSIMESLCQNLKVVEATKFGKKMHAVINGTWNCKTFHLLLNLKIIGSLLKQTNGMCVVMKNDYIFNCCSICMHTCMNLFGLLLSFSIRINSRSLFMVIDVHA